MVLMCMRHGDLCPDVLGTETRELGAHCVWSFGGSYIHIYRLSTLRFVICRTILLEFKSEFLATSHSGNLRDATLISQMLVSSIFQSKKLLRRFSEILSTLVQNLFLY